KGATKPTKLVAGRAVPVPRLSVSLKMIDQSVPIRAVVVCEHRSLKDKPLDNAEHLNGMIMDDERAIALSCFLWY
ncbi:hypothetical protein LTS06_012124, partial [Exophiala xenobiotica]